jgi:hypothetical protein
LNKEYQSLRELVITRRVSLIGFRWEASIKTGTHRSIVLEDAQRLLPPETFDALVRIKETVNVVLRERVIVKETVGEG